ncbi:hypothetical protein D3C78_1721700 [compost metagenome]
MPPLPELDGTVSVKDVLGGLIIFLVDQTAAEAFQKRAEGIAVPFGFIGHAEVDRIVELAAGRELFERCIKFFAAPWLVQRWNANAIFIENRFAGKDRDGCVPQAD